jgi:hypothetical protein
MKEREILPNEKRFVDDFDKLQEKFIVYSAIRTPDQSTGTLNKVMYIKTTRHTF